MADKPAKVEHSFSDMECQTPLNQNGLRKWGLRESLLCILIAVLILLYSNFQIRQAPPQQDVIVTQQDITLTVSCLYPLGGGVVPPGGGFPQQRLQAADAGCSATLQLYLTTQYDKDFEAAIASARQFFADRAAAAAGAANASQLIVFDIDETALSNEKPRIGAPENRTPALRAGQQLIGVVTSYAPALEPTLALYKELYQSGFSVTFITGRTDTEQGRKATAANLQRVGYGEQCPEERLQSSARRLAGDEEPCYVQLDMRAEGDTRLASVYKPDKRRQLQERGYKIIACFGDQFSDLDGTSSAVASFKLPNPWYYIV